jgi:hypothetical protein
VLVEAPILAYLIETANGRIRARLWPNHDMAFYRSLPVFPQACT